VIVRLGVPDSPAELHHLRLGHGHIRVQVAAFLGQGNHVLAAGILGNLGIDQLILGHAAFGHDSDDTHGLSVNKGTVFLAPTATVVLHLDFLFNRLDTKNILQWQVTHHLIHGNIHILNRITRHKMGGDLTVYLNRFHHINALSLSEGKHRQDHQAQQYN